MILVHLSLTFYVIIMAKNNYQSIKTQQYFNSMLQIKSISELP